MFPALMYEVLTMLLEGRDGVKCELIIGIYHLRGSRDNHLGQSFVSLEEVFCEWFGYGYEVGFEVFGVLDHEGRIDDCCEGLV